MTIKPFQKLPENITAAYTIFDMRFDEFRNSIPAPEIFQIPGTVIETDDLKVEYPVPLSAPGLKEYKGDDLSFRRIGQKSFELVPGEYQDGWEFTRSDWIKKGFLSWEAEAAAFATSEIELGLELIAGALENGTVATGFDGVATFANAHPVNLFDTSKGTYDNLLAGALTTANIAAAKQTFRERKAPNGKSAGLRLTHIIVPPELEQTAKDALYHTIVSGGAALPNRHADTVQVIVLDELTDANDWYAVAANRTGMIPWILLRQPGSEITHIDENSDAYKLSKRVGWSLEKRAVCGMAMPLGISKYVNA